MKSHTWKLILVLCCLILFLFNFIPYSPIWTDFYYCVRETNDPVPYESLGKDPFGAIKIEQDTVIRTFTKPYKQYKDLTFQRYQEFAKYHSDIIETQNYGNYLTHKKLIINYPFEWSANMLKDAFLFNLQLEIKLNQYGLVLFDSIPRNIVFNYTKPTFVDFFGFLAKDFFDGDLLLFDNPNADSNNFIDLKKKNYLFFSKPLSLMYNNQYQQARDLLKIFSLSIVEQLYINDNLGISNIIEENTLPSLDICNILINKLSSISISPTLSEVSSYYSQIKEDFDFSDQKDWKPKQHTIYNILNKYSPETVLDIGCNTGWFSILAEHTGAKVISIDIDEKAVDDLYIYSKHHKLKILPLKIGFNELDQKYLVKSKSFRNKKEIYIAPINRLQSDMVLCLSVVQDLVFNEGITIEKIMNILSRLTNKILVLEIPTINDTLLSKYHISKSEQKYNLDNFIKESKKYFKSYKIYNSHPKTRTIIVFEK